MDISNAQKVVVAPSIVEIMDQARIRENVVKAHCFYLGTNYFKAQETLAWAVKHSMITPDPARIFREACVKNKPAFVEMMGHLAKQANSTDWWALSISSKNPYLSQVFNCLVAFEMIRTFVSANTVSQLFLVIESPALATVFESYFLSSGVCVRRYRGRPRGSVRWMWKDLKRYVVPRVRFMKDEIVKRWILRKGQIRLPQAGLPVTLVRTWFFPNSFQKGRFHDVYFQGLPELLEKNGQHLLTVLSLYRLEDVERMRAFLDSHPGFVALEQIVGYWDMFKIFFRTLRPASIPPLKADFNGVDVSPLIEHEIRRTLFDPAFAFTRVHVLFVRRLHELGIRVQTAYLPYENQPWEKMFCFELRQRYPDIWIAGYQHATVFDLQLAYEASPTEIRLAPAPDAILSNGEFFANHFRRQGYPDVRVVYPLRYAYIDKHHGQSDGHPSPPSFDFLICTPADYSQTLEMIHRLVKLLSGKSCRVAVKTHTLIDWTLICRNLRQLGVSVPSDWELASEKMDRLISQSKAVIWTSSSVYLDALAFKKPVIHIVLAHTLDIEWFDLPGGCIHVYPEDTYQSMMMKLGKIQQGENGSNAIDEFVQSRLDFRAPLESFLKESMDRA